MTTYAETFETRKLQMLFARTSGGAVPEDDAVCTFHFLKIAGGVPVAEWVEADFTALETALEAFWTAIKAQFTSAVGRKEYRWYRAGPQRDLELGAPGRTGPPVRVLTPTLANGTATGNMMPPQCAVSITERTSDPKAWGRVYLPGLSTSSPQMDTKGRVSSAAQTVLANAFDDLATAALAASKPLVVYSSAKPARETKSGAELPAAVARALTVDKIQVDDLVDVIRSRRWRDPILRLQRDV